MPNVVIRVAYLRLDLSFLLQVLDHVSPPLSAFEIETFSGASFSSVRSFSLLAG
jgi:hypothetical protein